MPHLVILYTGQLDREANMTLLCRSLADSMLKVVDENNSKVFPEGGVRVFAYPAPHYAVSDGGLAGAAAHLFDGNPNGGSSDYAFVYLNLRMGKGRSEIAIQNAGRALDAATKKFFEPIMVKRHIGITLQVDVGPEVFDSKNSNIHPLFKKDKS